MVARSHTPAWITQDVRGFNELIDRLDEAGGDVYQLSLIVGDHMSYGNNKLGEEIAIFNMGSASDCPNLGTEHCQVPPEACYAVKTESVYKYTLSYRRRQEFLWDWFAPAPEVLAKAMVMAFERKHHKIKFVRFSESGDFRSQSDVDRVSVVSEILKENGIQAYTYTASDYLDFSDTAMVVNGSNENVNSDRRYVAVPTVEDIPEGAIHCPHDKYGSHIKCGTDCRACILPHSTDIYITIH